MNGQAERFDSPSKRLKPTESEDDEDEVEELFTLVEFGDEDAIAAALRNPLSPLSSDPNMTDSSGCTLLRSAAGQGEYSIVALLLGDKRVDPNIADEEGYTALMRAAEFGYDSIATMLLSDARVEPGLFNDDGNTALMFASNRGSAPVVTLLLADKRVNPDLTNQDGWTALVEAADKGHAPVVTLLLADERVDPNIAPATLAARHSSMLLMKGAPRW